MENSLMRFVSMGVRICIATIVTCLMVTVIPLIQEVILGNRFQKSGSEEQRQVLAEIVRPQKKEPPKTPAHRISKVDTRMNPAGSSAQAGMRFNFTPDLSVEGGGGEVAATSKDQFAPAIFEEGKTDEDVVPISKSMPQYPQIARDLGIQGEAEIIFVVNTEGRVESINIIKVPHPSFNAEIRKALAGWRFKPAKNQGIPVKLRMKQVITFTLNEEE